MQDPHGTHSAAGIVKDPLLLEIDVTGVHTVELFRNTRNHCMRVVAVRGHVALPDRLQHLGIKQIKAGHDPVEPDTSSQENGENGQPCHEARSAATATAAIAVFRLGSHGSVYKRKKKELYTQKEFQVFSLRKSRHQI